MYRSTPHSEFGKTPSELLFGWNIRNKLPELANSTHLFDHEEVCDNDKLQKENGELYADKKRRAKISSTDLGILYY